MQHPQHRLSARVISVAQRHSAIWLGLLVSGLLLCAYVPSALALSHAGLLTGQTSFQQLETIGYHSGWVKRLSKLASKAFEEDEVHMARRVWTALAEQGDAESAFRLGMAYDTGLGVERDAARAAYWYRRAAEEGHLHAQHNLAVAYANGDGVEFDFSEALRWWQQAARHGNADSQYNLGIVYATGIHGVHKNLTLAKAWWRKAAISGDPMAQYNLGTLYANGDGQTSYCEAMRWWEKSAQKGVQQAN